MGHFPFLLIKLKFQWAILSKFNIAISIVSGLIFCSMCRWPHTILKTVLRSEIFGEEGIDFFFQLMCYKQVQSVCFSMFSDWKFQYIISKNGLIYSDGQAIYCDIIMTKKWELLKAEFTTVQITSCFNQQYQHPH